jgi:hypothetical protein
MQNKTIPLFAGSAPELGAQNVPVGRDRFSVQLKREIQIPPEAYNITLELRQATLWWTVLNVEAGVNDAFRFLVSGDPSSPYDITLDPGLYDVSALNAAVNNKLINEGLASGLITITGDSATQKIILTFSAAGQRVEWVANSFYELCGFTLNQFVPALGFTTGPYSELATNVANFSSVSSFLVHTDLVQNGIPQGNSEHQMIADIPISVAPGSQQIYQPFNPTQININHWRGQSLNNYRVWITDQLNRTLDFNGENFTVLIIIKYRVDEVNVSHI